MPVQVSYPGVYIEELPSGVNTIVGVSTAVTAFVGRALRGRTNYPTVVSSAAEYQRIFGGPWANSTMDYAVQHFFQNGGSQAVIVRLYKEVSGVPHCAHIPINQAGSAAAAAVYQAATLIVNWMNSPTSAAAYGSGASASGNNVITQLTTYGQSLNTPGIDQPTVTQMITAITAANAAGVKAGTAGGATLTALQQAAAAAQTTALQNLGNTLDLCAVSEGAWGNSIQVQYDTNTATAGLFNLTVTGTPDGGTEVIRNLSVDPTNARRVDKVLEQESNWIRLAGPLPSGLPSLPAGTTSIVGTVATLAGDGAQLTSTEFLGDGNLTGIYALNRADIVNLICIPPYSYSTTAPNDIDNTVWAAAALYCQQRRALLIIDPPTSWNSVTAVKTAAGAGNLFTLGSYSSNAAVFFPRIEGYDTNGNLQTYAPCGAVAGIMSRTDAQRGVWKAPAGMDASFSGVLNFSLSLTDADNGQLNPLAVNCLRVRPVAGPVVWGARTLAGSDQAADQDWKYIPVRRLALYIEESLFRGTQWVVFEPNDEPLWSRIRLTVGSFMQDLYRQGAFQGQSPQAAYFVKCDKDTTTQSDINKGIVNIVVGFAPLKPAEFVILQLQQMAGQVSA